MTFKFIDPVNITDNGTLTSPAGQTYYDSTGTLQVAGANTPRLSYNPANLNLAPAYIVGANDVFSVGVISNVPENDYAAYSSVTTYSALQRVIVVTTSRHEIYESILGSNLNHDPVTSPTFWKLVGATNRFKMFDALVSSQTSNANVVAAAVTVQSRVDSVSLVNVDAASVTVTQSTAAGETFRYSKSLVYREGKSGLYDYLFRPPVRKTTVNIEGLFPYAKSTISIAAMTSSGNAKIGAVCLGLTTEVGGTQLGASTYIDDYSLKKQDAYGDYYIEEGAFNDAGDFDVLIENKYYDEIKRKLTKNRAKAVFYSASNEYSSTQFLGFYESFKMTIQYKDYSICTIKIRGLT